MDEKDEKEGLYFERAILIVRCFAKPAYSITVSLGN